MQSIRSQKFALLSLIFLFGINTFAAHPNVIVVMADDLGIGDVSPTNPDGKIKTPHLRFEIQNLEILKPGMDKNPARLKGGVITNPVVLSRDLKMGRAI